MKANIYRCRSVHLDEFNLQEILSQIAGALFSGRITKKKLLAQAAFKSLAQALQMPPISGEVYR